MSRRGAHLLAIAGAAAALQAIATLGAVAWISRALPVEALGRFGLYLAIVSLVLALDGIRQIVVVRAASHAPQERAQVEILAGISIVFGALVAVVLAVVGATILGLTWREWLPLSMTSLLLLATGPGFALLEASGAAHYAVLLHSLSWAASLSVAAVVASRFGDVALAAWTMLLAPLASLVVLRWAGAWVQPRLGWNSALLHTATQGIGSHLSTAVGGFLDKGMLAATGASMALGLYTPLAELVGRASALSGMASNLFLNDETRTVRGVVNPAGDTRNPRPLMDALFVFAACAIVAAAVAAPALLRLFIGQASSEQSLTLRLLLVGLALNIGAQWSAVTMRARSVFDFYRPYVASLAVAAVCAPWLILKHGIVGAAVTVLILRGADLALMFRARTALSPIQVASTALTASVVLTTAAYLR